MHKNNGPTQAIATQLKMLQLTSLHISLFTVRVLVSFSRYLRTSTWLTALQRQLVKPWTSQRAPLIIYNIVAWFSAQHGEQTSKGICVLIRRNPAWLACCMFLQQCDQHNTNYRWRGGLPHITTTIFLRYVSMRAANLTFKADSFNAELRVSNLKKIPFIKLLFHFTHPFPALLFS